MRIYLSITSSPANYSEPKGATSSIRALSAAAQSRRRKLDPFDGASNVSSASPPSSPSRAQPRYYISVK